MNDRQQGVHVDLRVARQAFTLIELLVVIGIIAVLAGLLLPALVRAKGKSQAVACLSNVKQWSLGVLMYVEDNDDYFPYEGEVGSLNQNFNSNAWYNTVAPYFVLPSLIELYTRNLPPRPGEKSIFLCPCATNRATMLIDIDHPYFAYGFNNRLDPNGPAQFKRSQVLRPLETVVFTENSEATYPSTSGVYAPARHDKRANLAFVDGHAAPTSEKEYRRTSAEDSGPMEWSRPRAAYWYPYPTAPQ